MFHNIFFAAGRQQVVRLHLTASFVSRCVKRGPYEARRQPKISRILFSNTRQVERLRKWCGRKGGRSVSHSFSRSFHPPPPTNPSFQLTTTNFSSGVLLSADGWTNVTRVKVLVISDKLLAEPPNSIRSGQRKIVPQRRKLKAGVCSSLKKPPLQVLMVLDSGWKVKEGFFETFLMFKASVVANACSFVAVFTGAAAMAIFFFSSVLVLKG